MLPNMNPKQMEKMMSQMGIKSRQIDASRVIIEAENEKIIISGPQVVEITMQGQKSYQISGSVSTEAAASEDHSVDASTESFSKPGDFENDIKMIMEQANCTREQAVEALKKSDGDIAQAILGLKKE